MLVAEKAKEQIFTDTSMKGAYLKACKWLSSNVLAVNNSRNIVYNIEKQKPVELGKYSVKLTLYVMAEESEIKERMCNICEECSSMMYLSSNKHKCESCKVNPYRRRLQEKLKLVKEGNEAL